MSLRRLALAATVVALASPAAAQDAPRFTILADAGMLATSRDYDATTTFRRLASLDGRRDHPIVPRVRGRRLHPTPAGLA